MKGTIASNQMRQPITGLRNPNTESTENGEYDGVFASCLEDGLGFLTFNAEVEEPRVLESLTQIHKDQKHADGGQSDESFHAGFSKPMPSVTPTSFGEFSMMNPSGEIDTDVEEVAWAANPNGGATRLFRIDYLNPSQSIGINMNAFAEGDGVRVSTQTCRFVKVSSSADSGSQQSYGANGPNLSSHDYMHPTGRTLGDQNDLTTETNSDTPIVQSMDINVKPNSYAKAAGASNVNQPKDHANFRPIVAEEVFDGVNISIPHKVVEKVSVRFENTLYGYFIGFEEDGISLIATYPGKPIMLDSYKSAMCKDSWGRSSFAWCLIEINSETDFKESITIGNIIPRGVPVSKGFQVGKDFVFKPRAPNDQASSKVGSSKITNDNNSSNNNDVPNARQRQKDVVDSGKMKLANIATPNPFTTLGEEEDEEEDVENIYDEYENLNIKNTGASTPAQTVVNENNLSVCAILESHVDVAIVYDTCKKVCSRWKWTSNGSLCSKGSRIILGWNDDIVDVMIMSQTNQVMHVQVNTRADHKTLFCSFVYADNYYIDRRELWNNLVGHAGLMRNRPWVLLGDFNAALNLEDHSAGGYEPNAAMREFKECVQAMEVSDVNCTGLHFTWNQKSKGSNGILKKIDRIMGNLQFSNDFPGFFTIFQRYRISDHSPCVLRIPKVTKPKPKPFKFSNFLVYKEGFREVVESGWALNVDGCNMYRVVKRLKGLRSPFHKLLHAQDNLYNRVDLLHKELNETQKAIDKDPHNPDLRDEHAHYLLAFKEASLDEERFLR
ncbi:RNA-directed DNA polymerase, eukaryota, reverse transcriptase zinc-binding domain protein, partial [Tanacetum coccineum]